MEVSHEIIGTSYCPDHRNEKKTITPHKRSERSSSSTCSSSGGDCSFSSSEEEEDMANCLILLARGTRHVSAYECKTCNRSFPSFQALGGHRASHKKPRTEEPKPKQEDQNNVLVFVNKRNPPGTNNKVHECSVCGSEFTSGQALGGHMRRHRAHNTSSFSRSDDDDVTKRRRDNILPLDLNLPAPEDDVHRSSSELKFAIVFSATPALVGCHY